MSEKQKVQRVERILPNFNAIYEKNGLRAAWESAFIALQTV
jgi:hypothetical protein